MQSDWKATHLSKTTGAYVRVVCREGGTVIIDFIDGRFTRLMEEDFNETFRDLGELRGYSDGSKEEGSGAQADEDRGEAGGQGQGRPQEVGGFRRYTQAEIDAAASPAGGYGKKELAALGVKWPPKRGWQEALLDGRDPNNPKRGPGSDDTELLRKLVITIIDLGQTSWLQQFPELIDRFGARLPTAEELAERNSNLRNDAGGPWFI